MGKKANLWSLWKIMPNIKVKAYRMQMVCSLHGQANGIYLACGPYVSEDAL
jgi:hypothetical protein